MLRLLFLLAMCQVAAPSLAAVADAWRIDRRESRAHIEEESSAGCPVVHHDNCALCAVAATTAPPPAAAAMRWLDRQCGWRGRDVQAVARRAAQRLASQRAPPIS